MAEQSRLHQWGLNDKQRLFAEEYNVDQTGYAAAKRAGYTGTKSSLETTASKLLRNPKVAAYLKYLQDNKTVETGITAERVLTEFARLGFSNITNVLSFNEEGVAIKDSETLTPDITASISSVTCNTTVKPDGSTFSSTKISLYDKTKALNDLGKHLGLFSDFNMAVAALEKYGLTIFTDEKGDWQVIDQNDTKSKSKLEKSHGNEEK
jgi:phage terminase small subunit